MKDPELLAEAANEKMDIKPMTGHEIDALLAKLYALPPDVIAKAAKAIRIAAHKSFDETSAQYPQGTTMPDKMLWEQQLPRNTGFAFDIKAGQSVRIHVADHHRFRLLQSRESCASASIRHGPRPISAKYSFPAVTR